MTKSPCSARVRGTIDGVRPMSWYHSSMYDTGEPARSYWEAEAPPLDLATPPAGDETCDIAIIGGGYTGLSAAYHLTRDGAADVRVLEAGDPGWGASGRNGGFCTLHPSGLSLTDLTKRFGETEARRYIRSQVEAIDLVTEIAEREDIDLQRQGDGYYLVAHAPSRYAELERQAELMHHTFGLSTQLHPADDFAACGYDSTEQFGALHVGVGYGLQPLRFARGLARAAARRGVTLHGHSEVLNWDKSDGWHRLATADGTVRARQVIVATNGYTRDRLHPALAGRLMPVISNILVTRPLTDTELSAQNWRTDCMCSNTRTLLFYYRLLPDRRFLFGARGDLTGRPEDGDAMRAWLARRVGEVFPAWADVEIAHYWRGFVCMTRDLTPALGQLNDDPSVWYALAYHGDGVAAAPWAGATVAKLILGTASRESVPAPFRAPPPVIPLAALRPWFLRAAIGYYRLVDDRWLN